MTSFAKMWLAAPEEVKALFEPDGRNEWVYIHEVDEYGTKIEKPIPRLDQLVGMVKDKWFLPLQLNELDQYELYGYRLPTMFGSSPEEAVLKGICWEHGYEWDGKAWVKGG